MFVNPQPEGVNPQPEGQPPRFTCKPHMMPPIYVPATNKFYVIIFIVCIMKSRKIPATMVTQHPDHASVPYWYEEAYISTQEEAEEAYRSFAELGSTEYKWDWEGKLVDESVLERLFGNYFDYFKTHPIGRDKFLTFRLPNPKVETEFRLSRAFMNIISAASISSHFGLHSPSIFEVIIPMTETAEEIFAIQEAFAEISHLKHPLFKQDHGIDFLEVIPLFEQVPTMIRSDKILEKYFSLYKKRFKRLPKYFRPYVARSDPALNSGIIPTVLGVKIALSHYKKLEKKTGIKMYPIIGAGSLPFRGGASPENIEGFINEYKGVRTTTIQSAFRHDYPLERAKAGIAAFEKLLPKGQAQNISAREEKDLILLIETAEKYYKSVVEQIAPVVNKLAAAIPARRERFLHVGLFGYARGEGKVRLPRAISYTCVMYSLGIPPELIGTGRAINFAIRTKKIGLLEKYYINLKHDLLHAGKFLNKENLKKLARKNSAWKNVEEDVKFIEEYLGTELEPITREEKEHERITGKILGRLDDISSESELITQAGILRKSLG